MSVQKIRGHEKEPQILYKNYFQAKINYASATYVEVQQ